MDAQFVTTLLDTFIKLKSLYKFAHAISWKRRRPCR